MSESYYGVSSVYKLVWVRLPVTEISPELGQELAANRWDTCVDTTVWKAFEDLPHHIWGDELCDGFLLIGQSHAIQLLHHVKTNLIASSPVCCGG
jgi:hypothetical protein